MARDYDALFVDIDGTILRNDHTMSGAVRDALNMWVADGGTLVLASSRSPQGILPIVREYGLARCCISAFGGALLLDEDGNVLAEHGYDRDLAARVATFAHDLVGADATCCTFTARHWYVDSRRDPRIVREEGIVKTTSQEGGVRAVAEGEPVDKLLFICDTGATARLRDALAREFPAMHVATSSPILVEVNAAGITKAVAVRDLCERRHLDVARTLAFGDAENDLPLLRAAGAGVAMGNATDAVKAQADATCESNEDDGVAHELRRRALIAW